MLNKRISAFIAALAMAGALVSCGDVDESSSDKKASTKAAAESTAASEAETTEAEAAAEATTEASTEEKTTAETTTEPASEEETAEPTEDTTDGEAAEDSIIGVWKPEYALTDTTMEFSDDGAFVQAVDFTSYYSATEEKGRYLGEETDISFDGKTLSLVSDGKVLITFEKISDEEGLDGTYRFVSDHTGQDYSNDPLETYVISSGKMMQYVEGTYTLNGNEISIVLPKAEGSLVKDYTFAVEGDKLTLTDEYGDEIYTRAE